MNLADYLTALHRKYSSLNISCPIQTPCHILGEEISEMVSSYLDDSEFFSGKNDIVNQYASLVYAQGWLDAGIYSGLISSSKYQLGDIDFLSIQFPDNYDKDHLLEKYSRYSSMLTDALESISLFPVHGSPFYSFGKYCQVIAQDALKKAKEYKRNKLTVPALGYLCYGYGWLDAAVRTGFIQITNRPELFTTEID
ncbi:MAG: DUF357 domain-containing protein [Methanomicrobiales archaeon]|nr:DUF357 domain-containing protein [Methanomicrobiales archaeon]